MHIIKKLSFWFKTLDMDKLSVNFSVAGWYSIDVISLIPLWSGMSKNFQLQTVLHCHSLVVLEHIFSQRGVVSPTSKDVVENIGNTSGHFEHVSIITKRLCQ